MESRKGKHDLQKPRITYHAPGRTFDRLLKEDSLHETKNVIRLKLGLQSDAIIKLQQLRDGRTVDLDDEDDFEAFCALAHEKRSMDVHVLFESQRDDSHQKRGRSKTPVRRSSTPVHDAAPASDEDHDERPLNKKRRVTFEVSRPRPDIGAVEDWLKSRLSNMQRFANTDASDRRLDSSHRDAIPTKDATAGTEEPKKGRKRAKSNAGLPSKDTINVAEPPREDKNRSKSKTRSNALPSKEPPSNADGKNQIHLNEGSEHVESEGVPKRDGAPLDIANAPFVEKEAAQQHLRSSADPDPLPTSSSRKSKGLRVFHEKHGWPTMNDGIDPEGNTLSETVAHASTSRASGRKRARQGQPEEIAIGEGSSEADATSPKEARLTARDQEIVQAVFSKVLAKHAKPVVSTATPQTGGSSIEELPKIDGQDSTLHVTPPNQASHVEERPPESMTSETDSENSVARALTAPAVSSTIPESKRSSKPLSKSAKVVKSAKVNKLPCPVCLETPFHLRYRCPVVLAGPDAIKTRLQELRSKDLDRHKELIEELERMLKSRGGASGNIRKSNVNSDPSSVPGHSERQTPSNASNKVADQPYQDTMTSKGINGLGKMGANKRSGNGETNNNGDSEESESTIVPQTSTSHNPSVSVTSLPYANINLDDIVRGPPITRSSLESILDDSIDEDASDDTEPEIVELDEEEDEAEGYDAKLRRLSKRYEKQLPSSDEESEKDESVSDDQEMSGPKSSHTGRTEALSFQAMADGDGASDIDQPNALFTNELAAVLNAAVDDSQVNTRVTISKENGANKDLTRPSIANSQSIEPVRPSQGRDTTTSSTSRATARKSADNGTRTAETDTNIPTSPIEDVQPPPSAEKEISGSADDDPIELAEDFPVVEQPPVTHKVIERMKTRNSSKASPTNTAETSRSSVTQTKSKTTKNSTNKTSNVHRKPTPDSTVEISSTGESSHPSLATERVTRSESKAKSRKTRAEMLAQAVAEKTPRRTTRKTARPVVLVPPPKPAPSPSLDQWTTLSPHDDASMVDQLPPSSPATQENDTTPINGNANEDSTAAVPHDEQSDATEPLFLPSESQIPFPYSQPQGDAPPPETPAGEKETPRTAGLPGSDSDVARARRPFPRRPSISYRSLSDIAKTTKALFSAPVSSPLTPSSRRSVGNRLSNLLGKPGDAEKHEEEEEESESDSSEDDKAQHIPKSRLAGVKAKAIRR